MLCIHNRNFEVRWSGWGAYTPHAERVALATMLTLMNKSAPEIHRLAASRREQATMSRAAFLAVRSLLDKRGKAPPVKATIILEGK